MTKDFNRCPECKLFVPYYQLGLCEDCYKDMFTDVKVEEPDFVLESETATITAIDPTEYKGSIFTSGPSVGAIRFPKWYPVDFEKVQTQEDFNRLIVAILAEAKFSDLSPAFENIKHLLKMPDQ